MKVTPMIIIAIPSHFCLFIFSPRYLIDNSGIQMYVVEVTGNTNERSPNFRAAIANTDEST